MKRTYNDITIMRTTVEFISIDTQSQHYTCVSLKSFCTFIAGACVPHLPGKK